MDIDLILSDPALLTGAALTILGPIIFIVAAFKYVMLSRQEKTNFIIPTDEMAEEPSQQDEDPTESDFKTEVVEPPADSEQEVIQEIKSIIPDNPPQQVEDKTAVLSPTDAAQLNDLVKHEDPKEQTASSQPQPTPPPATPPSTDVKELEGQLGIAFSQIKSLNQKVYELEDNQELIEKHQSVQLEESELKEPPMDPKDFVKKLLKLAEHVIVLEKEVARLKQSLKEKNASSANEPNLSSQQPSTKNPSRPPIMPI